jgi:hypothetical protein
MKRDREEDGVSAGLVLDPDVEVVSLRKYKKLKLTHQDTVGDTGVIAPLLEWFPECHKSGMPKVPDVEIQNVIFEHIDKIRTNYGNDHPKLRSLVAAGSPFVGKRCSRCHEVQYINAFTASKYGQQSFCSTCYNKAYSARYCTKLTVGEMDDVMKKVRAMAESVDVDEFKEFNRYKFISRCERVVKNGHRVLLERILKCGPAEKYHCTACDHSVYLWDLRIIIHTKNGFSTKCSRCHKISRPVLAGKAASMRNGGRDCVECPTRMLEAAVAKQAWRCYYSFIPLEDAYSSPWTPSPERLIRDGNYDDADNVVAIAEIFNVAGNFNFSRRLVQQFHYNDKLTTFYSEVTDLRKKDERFLKVLLYTSKHTAKKRASRLSRNDESGVHTITYDDILAKAAEQKFRCAVSGIPLVFRSKHMWSASLDRLDNSKGYTPDNIRLTLQRFNPSHRSWNDETVAALRNHLNENIGLVNAVEHFESIADLQEQFDPNE